MKRDYLPLPKHLCQFQYPQKRRSWFVRVWHRIAALFRMQ